MFKAINEPCQVGDVGWMETNLGRISLKLFQFVKQYPEKGQEAEYELIDLYLQNRDKIGCAKATSEFTTTGFCATTVANTKPNKY